MLYAMVDEEGRVQRVQNVSFNDLPTDMAEVAVEGYGDVAVYMAYLSNRAGGDPLRAVVDATGAFVARTSQPTPPAERLADKRAAMLETLRSQVNASPICRAIWEGAAIDALASAKGWAAADIAAAERLMLRYALLAGDVPAPAWVLASRYEE